MNKKLYTAGEKYWFSPMKTGKWAAETGRHPNYMSSGKLFEMYSDRKYLCEILTTTHMIDILNIYIPELNITTHPVPNINCTLALYQNPNYNQYWTKLNT